MSFKAQGGRKVMFTFRPLYRLVKRKYLPFDRSEERPTKNQKTKLSVKNILLWSGRKVHCILSTASRAGRKCAYTFRPLCTWNKAFETCTQIHKNSSFCFRAVDRVLVPFDRPEAKTSVLKIQFHFENHFTINVFLFFFKIHFENYIMINHFWIKNEKLIEMKTCVCVCT